MAFLGLCFGFTDSVVLVVLVRGLCELSTFGHREGADVGEQSGAVLLVESCLGRWSVSYVMGDTSCVVRIS
jgi:hypothetical protein